MLGLMEDLDGQRVLVSLAMTVPYPPAGTTPASARVDEVWWCAFMRPQWRRDYPGQTMPLRSRS